MKDYLSKDRPVFRTKGERIRTWFHYYKWYVVALIIVLILLLPVFRNLSGIGLTEADYHFALVTKAGISDKAMGGLTDALERLGRDLNGDGKVKVEIHCYDTGTGDEETRMYVSYASTITIQADIERNLSHFFILDDPATFQIAYQALSDTSGRLPDDDDFSTSGRVFPLTSGRLEMEEDVRDELASLVIGTRGYRNGTTVENMDAYDALMLLIRGGNE